MTEDEATSPLRGPDSVADPRGGPLLVLIGPAAAGKTTVGAAVAAHLSVPFVDIDADGDRYYAQVGWSVDRLIARIGEVGRVQAEREWEVARAHAVQEAVREHPGTVLALGAGHTVLTSPEHSTTVHRALASCALVVLLLPREDRDEALTELRRRSLADKGTAWISDGHDFLAEWLDSPSNRTLATLTFVSAERTIAETACELAALIPAGQAVRPPQ